MSTDDGRGVPASPPRALRVDIVGGDPWGHGDLPALSWWLPEGTTRQTAYRIVTDDGYDTGLVESDWQSLVPVPVFDGSRRSTLVRVQVVTDLGKSGWSDPVPVDSGLVGQDDWTAAWIGVEEDARPPKGQRPAYWLRTTFEAPEDVDGLGRARLYAPLSASTKCS